MNLIEALFGSGRDLDTLQMAARAAAIFIAALVLIRISGRRSFGQRSPFDYVVAILLGATLSRIIVGASPAVPTAIASFVIVLLHRILAWGCVRSERLERLVGGARASCIAKDALIKSRCRRHSSPRRTCSKACGVS